jgi:hypothetical protein
MASTQSPYADYFINVNPLTTTNQTPVLTGQVKFERLKNQTIHITVNYITYKLFDGNLGIDESVTPNIWKLHFSSPLYPGNYDVEASVVDVTNNIIVVSDNVYGELNVVMPPPTSVPYKQQSMSIPQKVALVAGLLDAVSKIPGGSGNTGVGGNPAVHPTTDDDGTTSLPGRADKERKEDPRVTSKKKRQEANKIPRPPIKHPFGVVGAGGDGLGALGGLIGAALGAAKGGLLGAITGGIAGGALGGVLSSLTSGAPTSLADLAKTATGGAEVPSMDEATGALGEAASTAATAAAKNSDNLSMLSGSIKAGSFDPNIGLEAGFQTAQPVNPNATVYNPNIGMELGFQS